MIFDTVTFKKSVRYAMENHTKVDRTLIMRAKAADKNALGRIYDLFIDRVYRFVYYRIGHPEDAEDVTEQVFVKVLTNIDGYEDRGFPFEAWLFRIVRNQITDYYRKKKHRSVSLDEAIEVTDPAPTPEDKVATKLAYEEVIAALPRLPESYQEIILLKFVSEMENHEISTIIQKPVDQVRVLQSRALTKLKLLLKP